MRLLILRIILLAWALSLATISHAMSLGETHHLLTRSGFAATKGDIQFYQSLSRKQAVDELLSTTKTSPSTSAPSWVNEPPIPHRVRKNLSTEEKQQLRKKIRGWSIELKSWWYQEMLTTESPLTERMTLFWHNHFTSSLQKVKWPPLLYRQNLSLRQHAMGNYRELLIAMLHDPAMLLYLDNAKSKQGNPNENFARELFELFSLGEGHYSEQDVKDAARALTGYSVKRQTGEFKYRKHWHDTGYKRVLGRSGNLDGDDVINAILEHPEFGQLIVRKLWREFISLQPDQHEVNKLVAVFRQQNYEIKPLIKEIFLSGHFWQQQNRGALIKSPVEFLVGTSKLLDLNIDDPRILVISGKRLGQDIFSPPNVKGWPGGKNWINSQTLLLRNTILKRLQAGKPVMQAKTMSRINMHIDYESLPSNRNSLINYLLVIEPVNPIMQKFDKEQMVADILSDPVYQLK